VAFWVFWFAAAAFTKRDRTRPVQGIGVRLAIVVLVFFVFRLSGVFKGSIAAVNTPVLAAVGTAIFVIGIGCAVWARLVLGRNWGMPMSLKAEPELVTTGPYRYVRHPIYTGIIAAMLGTALTVGLYWLIVVAVLGGYFVYSATVEDRNLEQLFPAAFPAYKRSTRMLIPFVL
jgi:protein-S-isoprenylcysteine O-methyltransferase Ste14